MGPSAWVRMREYGISLAPVFKSRGERGLLLWVGASVVALLFLLRVLVDTGEGRPDGAAGESAAPHPCARIVSLAPSLTEVAFSLGLGDAVVAVSGYDTFPPSVLPLPKIGGALDASPERIASFKPTLVLSVTEMADIVSALDRLEMASLVVDHRSVSGILDSVRQIGVKCRVESTAAELLSKRRDVIEKVKSRDSGRGERVLVTVASASSLDDLTQMQLSGSDGFYGELIRFTGAIPVITTPSMPLAQISMEGIGALQPSVIFEVFERPLSTEERELRRKQWREWSMIPAVAEGRIVALDADYAGIPGPRFDRLLLDIERAMTKGKD